MITRAKGGISPRRAPAVQVGERLVQRTGVRAAQHPASRSTTLSVACAMTRLSRPISPSLLTTTAVLASAGSLSAWLRSVVLPPEEPGEQKDGRLRAGH
jgi:hypothetical protein